MSKIYTKKGDSGLTSLIGKDQISKADPRVSAYGTIDELNCHIGMAIEWLKEKPSIWLEHLIPEFEQIQNELFNLGSQLACADSQLQKALPGITKEMTLRIENQIDSMQTNLPELKNFILPGGTLIAAQIHICRSVCRRAEREIVSLPEDNSPTEAIQYINRLSDYFFTAARFSNFNLNAPDILWRKT